MLKPLSSDYGTHDGLNPSCGIIDEFHAHKDSGMFDVIKSAFGARRQPLMFIITTAGFNKSGACFAYRDNVIKVLRGVNTDDSLFGIIYEFTKRSGGDFAGNVTSTEAVGSIESIVGLTVSGLNEGARKSGSDHRYSEDDVWDIFDDEPQLILEVSAIFVESITPLTDKLGGLAGKKLPAATAK